MVEPSGIEPLTSCMPSYLTGNDFNRLAEEFGRFHTKAHAKSDCLLEQTGVLPFR